MNLTLICAVDTPVGPCDGFGLTSHWLEFSPLGEIGIRLTLALLSSMPNCWWSSGGLGEGAESVSGMAMPSIEGVVAHIWVISYTCFTRIESNLI